MTKSYPTSEVRGSGLECQAVTAQEWLRGATLRLRPGAATEAGTAAGRSNPMPKARGSSQEEQPHVQGVVAARVQEGLEELFHIQDQEGRW